ncbi:MAG: DUF1588 domain-containing protein [Planctomycetales bacterium]|nr:DUF1588 domain-containing protein [Planctomycetales bacterium]
MSLYLKINAHPRGLQTNTDFQSQIAFLTKKLKTSGLGSAMALTAALLCSSNLLFAQSDKTTTPIFADKKAFDDTVSPFLSTYCADCHGENSNESDVVLSSISFDLASGHDMELWKTVLRQLHVEEMPPTESKQPEQYEKDAVMFWINSELKKSGNVSDLYAKLESPSFGNYVNHEKLFSGEITTEPFSPARLWRTSPNVFENVKSNYGQGATDFRQPFPLEDKVGIKDYANLLFADSAVVSVLLSNAACAADELIKHSPIASSDTSPTDDMLDSAISQHFRKVVGREPLREEISKYSELFRKTAKEGSNAEAMRLVFMAIMLHHESVYRVEIGLGEEDSHGRRMLSGTEMAFAIAFALTDRPPDAALLQAAEAGKLNSSTDAQFQVARMLQDDAIGKPRILRFFQEFFGYAQAHKVFKDEDRSGGFAYYGENYPVMYEKDADFFVMNILEKDKDVFRQLLTSDEYYIINRATFRNTVYDFYKKNQQQLDAGEYPESKQQELLQRLNLKGWHELNEKYNLHNFNKGFDGSVAAIKQIVDEQYSWMDTKDENVLLHRMQALFGKYPMVYDLRDDEQDFLLPQPYRRPHRAGILTHPAWLIAHSLNDSTDPIRRGKWVREHLLGGVIPDIPITVDASIPEDHNKTLRERLQKTEKAECWRCHRKMNPLGYAFEIYDDFGRYRTEESLDKGETKPVDARSELADTGEQELDGEFKDALELIARLAESGKVRQCMIRHVFRYFMGRNELLSDSKTLISADRAYLESGGSFKALLISLLSSDSFLYRKTLEPTLR